MLVWSAGLVTGVAWSTELHAMLKVDQNEETYASQRSQRFPSMLLERLGSLAQEEAETPLWQALSVAFTESMEVQAAAHTFWMPDPEASSASLHSLPTDAADMEVVAKGNSGAVPSAPFPIASQIPAMETLIHQDMKSNARDRPVPPGLAAPAEQQDVSAAPVISCSVHSVHGHDASIPQPTTAHTNTRNQTTEHDGAPGHQVRAQQVVSVADSAVDAADAKGTKKLSGVEILRGLLEERLHPNTASRCVQSARPACGGKRGAGRSRRRARSAGSGGGESDVKLRWSYDGGVGYGVPTMELDELVELEAETRKVAVAAVEEFAKAQRQEDRHEAEQVC